MRGWHRWACPPAATQSCYCTSSPPWPHPTSCNLSPTSCQVPTPAACFLQHTLSVSLMFGRQSGGFCDWASAIWSLQHAGCKCASYIVFGMVFAALALSLASCILNPQYCLCSSSLQLGFLQQRTSTYQTCRPHVQPCVATSNASSSLCPVHVHDSPHAF